MYQKKKRDAIMIIDFHTHCFPEKIAQRAISGLSYSSGGITPNTDGALSALLNAMNEDTIDMSVVLHIATNERQQKAVNDFASKIQSERIISFGSVYPDAPDALEELERIKELGLLGVKLHPEFQKFYVDDEKMKPIYKKISDLGLITLFHAGMDIGYRPPYHCTPERLEKALSWFSAPVVAAHFGGIDDFKGVIKRLCGIDGLYLDTAYSYGVFPKPVTSDIIEAHGVDKILFGSDCPWHRAGWEKKMIDSLELTEAEKNKIYFENAKTLLNI